MMEDCKVCGWEGCVDHTDESYLSTTCTCSECGSVFKTDADADFDGEDYQDCSTPGELITKGTIKHDAPNWKPLGTPFMGDIVNGPT